MTIIGITGPAGAGKSTLAAQFATILPGNVERMAFADPIRGMLRAIGITPDQLHAGKHATTYLGHTPRYMLQTLGTEWGRNLIGPDVWVRVFADRLLSVRADVVVVDDVRFENEAALIRSTGGAVVHLKAGPGQTPADSFREHPSERGVEVKAGDVVAFAYQWDPVEIATALGFDMSGVECVK